MAAVVTQVLLLPFYHVVAWVDLYPWNDVRGGNSQGAVDLVLALVQAVLIAGMVRGSRWVRGAGLAVYGVWLGPQVLN